MVFGITSTGTAGMVCFCQQGGEAYVKASMIISYIPYRTRPYRTIAKNQVPIATYRLPISNYHVPYRTSLKVNNQFHPPVKKSQCEKHCCLKHWCGRSNEPGKTHGLLVFPNLHSSKRCELFFASGTLQKGFFHEIGEGKSPKVLKIQRSHIPEMENWEFS